MRAERQTVDLTAYPELVVIYLGMRVRRPRGMLKLLGLGPQIQKSWKAKPDGLLLHEDLVWSLVPPHLGMRQYWRDLDSLERWTRSEPHRRWWQDFLKDSGGTGFWHETYFMRGGLEAIYDDMAKPTGLARFAPATPARGAMFSARHRAGRHEEALTAAPVIAEHAYYDRADNNWAEGPRWGSSGLTAPYSGARPAQGQEPLRDEQDGPASLGNKRAANPPARCSDQAPLRTAPIQRSAGGSV